MICNEFAMSDVVVCGVVGDDCQVFNTLFDNSVDDLHCASHSEESAEHNCHAVMNLLNGLLQCNLLIHSCLYLICLIFNSNLFNKKFACKFTDIFRTIQTLLINFFD